MLRQGSLLGSAERPKGRKMGVELRRTDQLVKATYARQGVQALCLNERNTDGMLCSSSSLLRSDPPVAHTIQCRAPGAQNSRQSASRMEPKEDVPRARRKKGQLMERGSCANQWTSTQILAAVRYCELKGSDGQEKEPCNIWYSVRVRYRVSLCAQTYRYILYRCFAMAVESQAPKVSPLDDAPIPHLRTAIRGHPLLQFVGGTWSAARAVNDEDEFPSKIITKQLNRCRRAVRDLGVAWSSHVDC